MLDIHICLFSSKQHWHVCREAKEEEEEVSFLFFLSSPGRCLVQREKREKARVREHFHNSQDSIDDGLYLGIPRQARVCVRSSSSLCEQARQIARCQVAVVFCLVINWSSVFDDDNDNHCIRERKLTGQQKADLFRDVRRARVVSTFLVYVWRSVQRWIDYDWSLDEGCSSIDIADLFQFSPRLTSMLFFRLPFERERESPSGECIQLSVSVVNCDQRWINRTRLSSVNVSSSLMILLLLIPWNRLISEREEQNEKFLFNICFVRVNIVVLARQTCIDS